MVFQVVSDPRYFYTHTNFYHFEHYVGLNQPQEIFQEFYLSLLMDLSELSTIFIGDELFRENGI